MKTLSIKIITSVLVLLMVSSCCAMGGRCGRGQAACGHGSCGAHKCESCAAHHKDCKCKDCAANDRDESCPMAGK